jgi:hypothetical protein
MKFLLDSYSLLLTCPPETALRDIESSLSELNLTLGYHPSQKVRTLGEALTKRIPNLLSERYGEIDDLCVSLKALQRGPLIQTKNVPRSATGPDFKKILASGNGFVLVEVTLRVSPKPEKRAGALIRWKNREGLAGFLKLFWASGIRPSRFQKKGSKALTIALEGFSDVVEAEMSELRTMARQTRGTLHAGS